MKGNKIINGKEIRDNILNELKLFFSKFEKENKRKAILSVFMVGNNSVTESFVEAKKKVAQRIGVDFHLIKLEKDISQSDLENIILAENKKTDGIVVQLPLPEHINKERVLNKINLEKDVDLLSGMAWENFLQMKKEEAEAKPLPPVAAAVYEILKSQWVENSQYWKNKNILLIGYGKLVGEPVAILLEKLNFSFEIVDKDTPFELFKEKISQADLIISGVGYPELIKNRMLKENVFLIDAGTSSVGQSLIGDISLDCLDKASFFSKTPGGVGPVTTAIIFQNLKKLLS